MLLKRMIRFHFMVCTFCGAKRRLCFLVVKAVAPIAKEIKYIDYGCFSDPIQISRRALEPPEVWRAISRTLEQPYGHSMDSIFE